MFDNLFLESKNYNRQKNTFDLYLKISKYLESNFPKFGPQPQSLPYSQQKKEISNEINKSSKKERKQMEGILKCKMDDPIQQI